MKQEESKVKSIEAYKTDLITIVEKMEEEHGCKISRVTIGVVEQYVGAFNSRTDNVEIEV